MIYEELKPLERSEAVAELASADWERISRALVSISLYDLDPVWVQQTVLPHLEHPHHWVRGVAAMCFGHVARIHGYVDTMVIPAIRELLKDPMTRGNAQDALEDIAHYISSKRTRRPPNKPSVA